MLSRIDVLTSFAGEESRVMMPELSNPMRISGEQKFLDPEIETMPRDQLEAYQTKRLREIVTLAYEKEGLTREKWDQAGITPEDIRTLADFSARVPFIDKDEIRAYRDRTGDPFGGLLCVPPDDLRMITSTSGTTGDPTLFAQIKLNSTVDFSRIFWECGIRPGDFVVDVASTFRGISFKLLTDYGLSAMMFDHEQEELGRLVEMVRQYRPTMLLVLSTPLIFGLEKLEHETGMDLRSAFAPMKAVIFGGEPLGPHARSLTERWGMNIYELSACGDTSTALECSAHQGVHAWEDQVFVEHLVPATGLPAEDGTNAELVVTSLDNEIDPLIRYRTDDIVWLTRNPCDCGRTHLRFRVIGRRGDEVTVRGRAILPRDVWPVIDSIEETHAELFQIIKTASVMDRLRLRVGHDGPATEALRSKVEEGVHDLLGIPVDVELISNLELLKLGPPHKIPRITKA